MTAKEKSRQEKLGQGVGFERIRRITGYLVGTMDKWNDAKRSNMPALSSVATTGN